MIFFAFEIHAQSICIDSCGIDTGSKLNRCEVLYFKRYFSELRNEEIKDKRFAFAYMGNILNKKEYFDKWGRAYYYRQSTVSNQLLDLSEEEKYKANGIDYLVVCWSKIKVSDSKRKKLIKRIKAYNKRE